MFWRHWLRLKSRAVPARAAVDLARRCALMVTLPACIQQADSANSKHTIDMNEAAETVPRAPKEINLTEKNLRNFWKKVDKRGPDDCWLWTASKSSTGYGQLMAGGRILKSHRIAWTLTGGAIPNGFCVCHKCDTPACVNPAHLFIGSHTDNMRDMINKGRGAVGDRHGSRIHPERVPRGDRSGSRLHPERVPRGEAVGTAKLTASQVIEIRALYADGDTLKRLASRFGVSFSVIGSITRRETWRHIP